MTFKTLRLKHKISIVDHAIRIFGVSNVTQDEYQKYIDFLIASGDLPALIASLKNRQDVMLSKDTCGLADLDRISGSVESIHGELHFHASEIQRVKVTLTNQSHATWDSKGTNPFNLSYHWYSVNGEVYHFNGLRTPLPKPIAPGCSQTIETKILSPTEFGEYQLEITMVMEGRFWCEGRGLRVRRLPVYVDLPKLSLREERIYQNLLTAISQRKLEVM